MKKPRLLGGAFLFLQTKILLVSDDLDFSNNPQSTFYK
jgi:hypothetical protein